MNALKSVARTQRVNQLNVIPNHVQLTYHYECNLDKNSKYRGDGVIK